MAPAEPLSLTAAESSQRINSIFTPISGLPMTRDISGRSRQKAFSASPGRFLLSIHEFAVVGILPAIAAMIGLVAWSGEPLTLPLALLFPAVWAFAPSRLI